MIDLGTLAGLFERRHELHAYCLHCDRWRTLDLAALVRAGQGARRLPLTVRCRACGEAGQLQVRPPMPTRASSGWIAPPVPVPGNVPATNRDAGAPRSL
ncbi:MAG TPA: hypothetical protein VFP48_04995 [Steroidobacteraceae bacterium]|nr:hypothetical protein [Steroidobacteraceae bacterium]